MSRFTLLASIPRDAGQLARARLRGHPQEDLRPGDALSLCVDWLCRTHDATSRQGSSKAYSLLHGWLPGYPETTGYVLGTLLHYGERHPERSGLFDRAREMGDWLAAVQEDDGGIMEGHVETRPRHSIVFNTGMVLHGWLDLIERGSDAHTAPAERAAEFLRTNLRADGTWNPEYEFAGIPHTYNSRVAWAMARWGLRSGSTSMIDAAGRQLDWVCEQQDPDGWFDNCGFRPGFTPSTHGIAYTLRGLLESHALLDNARWLDAAVRGSEALIPKLEAMPRLVADYGQGWQPRSSHACLTGIVQLGGVWMRLHQLTGNERFLRAGRQAVEQGASFQHRRGPEDIRGALAGSFPIWGRYAPLQYPNWATKFLADALMLYEDLS